MQLHFASIATAALRRALLVAMAVGLILVILPAALAAEAGG
jgi:hypothetical protein